mmetsp:Transcript_8392/g.17413  ORF Transcript_8392/g.17413 Transcript_8392/m.17413 type:complete len:163 (+) Transcript_8392:60-548(+)
MNSCVGTIYYVAPEVLFGEYTAKADIWSIGVVAYVLLCGFPPFNAGSEGLTYNIVKEGNVKFPSPAWDKISPAAIDFIKRLLDKDPDRRPSAAEAMEDPWITHENENVVRPFWHGTFMPTARKIDHADTNRRDQFIRIRSQRKLQTQRFTLTGSLRSYLNGT